MNKKLILYLTSLTLAMSPMSVLANEYTGPTATIEALEGRASLKATGEYKSWKQYDSRWRSMTMGAGGDTMAASGCLVTAIAMLMVHSGAADENGVDPGKLCTYLSNNGGFTGNSELYWAKINGAVEGFKLANYSVKLEGSRYDKAAKIKRYLDAGQYVVVSVGNNAHWVAVNYADDNGNVYIFDPGYSYTSLFGSYNDAGIINMATFTSTGKGQGNIDTGDVEITDYNVMGTVDVGASYLNVRAGAGTDKNYLKDSSGNRVTLKDGEEVRITGKGTDASGNVWYRVSINGLVGYVYGAYIDVSTSSVEGAGTPAKVTGSYVNIRAGAGTAYDVVGVAPKNAQITVHGSTKDSKNNLWYKIKYGSTIGYILAEYVQTEDEEQMDETIYSQSKAGKVNVASVYVRKGAGYDKATATTLSLNTKVTVLGEVKTSDGTKWYKVKYNGGEGYMVAQYITITDDDTDAKDYPESKKGVVNEDWINVRAGAGTNYAAKTSLRKNTAVTIVGEAKDSSGAVWYKIKYAGGEGYMRHDFINISGSGDDNSNTDSNYEQKSGKVKNGPVNVRKGAGTNKDVITTAATNTKLTIVGESKDSSGYTWYKVKYSNVEGYIRADYLTVIEDNDDNNTTNTNKKTGKVNTGSVNVRAGAGTNNRVVGNLSSPTAVTVVGEVKDSDGDTWYKIEYSGGSGYMLAKYITLDGADNNNSNGNGSSSTINGKVNANGVNVRKGAGTSNSVVKTLNTGFAVIITGEAKDSSGAKWYKVVFSGGEGYIHSDYVTIINAPASSGGSSTGNTTTPSYTQKKGYVNQDFVNVRADAGTNYAAKTSLRKNAAVTITGEKKDSSGAVWYKITYSGGSGYMRHDFITIGTPSTSTESGNNSSSGSSSTGTGTAANVPTEGVAGKEGVVNQPQVNVRKSANSNAEVLIVLEQNTSVFIETASKDSAGIVWYKISFAGETGYMMGQFLTVK